VCVSSFYSKRRRAGEQGRAAAERQRPQVEHPGGAEVEAEPVQEGGVDDEGEQELEVRRPARGGRGRGRRAARPVEMILLEGGVAKE